MDVNHVSLFRAENCFCAGLPLMRGLESSACILFWLNACSCFLLRRIKFHKELEINVENFQALEMYSMLVEVTLKLVILLSNRGLWSYSFTGRSAG